MKLRLRKIPAFALKTVFAAVCVAIVYFRLASSICWYGLGAAVAGVALWRGRWEERAVAAGMVVAAIATVVAWPNYWTINRPAMLEIDSALAVLLVVVAVRSRLWWPSWCAAFQCTAVANHLVFDAWPGRIGLWAYVSGVYIWSWLALIALAFGTFDAWLARRAQPPASAPAPAGATRR